MRKRVAYLIEFRNDPKGSMTVEFVVFAPLLIAALVMSFEFGKTFWAYDVITRDLRAAVRYLSRASANCATSATYRTAAENIAKRGVPDTSEAIHFPWAGAQPFGYDSDTFPVGTYNVGGELLTMTANVRVPLVFPEFINDVLGVGGDSFIPLAVSYQARCIGN